jgi:hypothetical protein
MRTESQVSPSDRAMVVYYAREIAVLEARLRCAGSNAERSMIVTQIAKLHHKRLMAIDRVTTW